MLAYFGTRLSEFVVTPALGPIMAGVGVSEAFVGLGFTGMTVAYALVQLPSGVLGDRVGELRVVLGVLALTVAGSVLLASAWSGTALLAAMVVLGAVTGAYYNPATTLLADLYDETGRAIGVHRLSGQAVGLTAPAVGVVAAAHGWRVAALLGAVATVPAFVGFWLLVRSGPRTRADRTVGETVDLVAGLRLLARPSLAYTTLLAGLCQFAEVATFGFLYLLLGDYTGFDPVVAGVLFVVYVAVLSAAQPAAGWLSDRAGRDPATAATLVLGALGYVLVAENGGLVGVAAGVALVGVGMGWGPPVQSRLLDHLPDDGRGAGFGVVRTAYLLVGSLGGVVVGGLAGTAGWSTALLAQAGVLAAGVAVVATNRLLGLGL